MKNEAAPDTPSLARRATRGVMNLFVPLTETRWLARSVRHMAMQQKKRLNALRQAREAKPLPALTWAEALALSGQTVATIDRRFRRRRAGWRCGFWGLTALALFLTGMICAAPSLPVQTLLRALFTVLLMLTGAALCASKALIAGYRLWQLHERRVSEAEKGTFRDFLDARHGWFSATCHALTARRD